MRILTLGDVVGTSTVHFLQKNLWNIRKREKIDFVIANGENATEIRGLSARDAQALLDAGVDLITLGDHTYRIYDLYSFLENSESIIRPANFPAQAPGNGYTVCNVNGWRLLCINVLGRVFLDAYDNPFDVVDRILAREKGNYDFAVMDIHAEATSEKIALSYYFDGRIQVMFGTHTHVQTADERILPNGSGYITDLGMCGPENGVLGTDAGVVIQKFQSMMPVRFQVADGEPVAHGAIFTLDEDSKRVTQVTRITF